MPNPQRSNPFTIGSIDDQQWITREICNGFRQYDDDQLYQQLQRIRDHAIRDGMQRALDAVTCPEARKQIEALLGKGE